MDLRHNRKEDGSLGLCRCGEHSTFGTAVARVRGAGTATICCMRPCRRALSSVSSLPTDVTDTRASSAARALTTKHAFPADRALTTNHAFPLPTDPRIAQADPLLPPQRFSTCPTPPCALGVSAKVALLAEGSGRCGVFIATFGKKRYLRRGVGGTDAVARINPRPQPCRAGTIR